MTTPTKDVRLRFLLPSLTAISSRPVPVIASFLALSLLSAVLAPGIWDSLELLRTLGLATSTTVLAGAGAVTVLNRRPPKPREPRRVLAQPRSAGRQPPPTLPLLMQRCVICNRPLKDPVSMRTGVGPDCRTRYGARPQYRPNPEFALWQHRAEQLRRDHGLEQRALAQGHANAVRAHQQQLRAWEAELASPNGAARAEAQSAATRAIGIDVGVIAAFALSDAIGRAAIQAGLPSLF